MVIPCFARRKSHPYIKQENPELDRGNHASNSGLCSFGRPCCWGLCGSRGSALPRWFVASHPASVFPSWTASRREYTFPYGFPLPWFLRKSRLPHCIRKSNPRQMNNVEISLPAGKAIVILPKCAIIKCAYQVNSADRKIVV